MNDTTVPAEPHTAALYKSVTATEGRGFHLLSQGDGKGGFSIVTCYILNISVTCNMLLKVNVSFNQ